MGTYLGYRDGTGTTNEQGFKQELNKLFTKGVAYVHSATSLQVSQRGSGANMSVDVAIGDAHLVRPDGAYSYWGWTDTATNVVVSAADTANPRVDVVVAYVDLSVTAGTNNSGALKFRTVNGTPSASPVAVTDSVIQSTLGASVPFIRLAYVYVAANTTTITNSAVTDARSAIALKGRLYGGSSNTAGHLVPNVADDTVALTSAAQTLTNKTLDNTTVLGAGLITLGLAQITSNFATAANASDTQVTGLTATVTVPAGSRRVKVTVFARYVANGTTGTFPAVSIWQGAVGTGTQLGRTELGPSPSAGHQYPVAVFATLVPSAGSYTFNVSISSNGSGVTTLFANSVTPATLLVEAM